MATSNRPIALDRYVYEEIYPAFKATTDEKEITAKINRRFLNYLAERNLVLTGSNPLAVADIGCGPCDTLVKYLTGVRFAPGFIVRATDYIPEYADVERGEAFQTLKRAQAQNTIKIANFSTRAGNAFAGKLVNLLSPPEDKAVAPRGFCIAFASHLMYHAESSKDVERLVEDVAHHVLDRGGVCMLYHVANTPGTFQEFRARFGSQAGAQRESDTGAVTIDDPPAQIASACRTISLPLYQTEFITRLKFGPLLDEEWQAFKNPEHYDLLADENPMAYEDLKRLYFVIQRAPLEFGADHSETGLAVFIDQIRRVIEANQGALLSAECMQVFSRVDAIPALAREIPDALATAIA